jgi:hypothetical protein
MQCNDATSDVILSFVVFVVLLPIQVSFSEEVQKVSQVNGDEGCGVCT